MAKKPKNNNFSEFTKQTILNKSDGRCWYCGIELLSSREYHSEFGKSSFTIDHFYNDGGNDLQNLVPACKDCNSRKKTKDVEAFRKTEAQRHGVIFSDSQRAFWKTFGINLPNDYPYSFYFERMGLRR